MVDKRAGFYTPEVVGSNPGSGIFYYFFFKYIESIFGSNIAPPQHIFFIFPYIVQYLYVHCTIPSILGSHLPYPTSPPTLNIATNQPPPPRPTPTPTLDLHPRPDLTLLSRLFFAFSQ